MYAMTVVEHSLAVTAYVAGPYADVLDAVALEFNIQKALLASNSIHERRRKYESTQANQLEMVQLADMRTSTSPRTTIAMSISSTDMAILQKERSCQTSRSIMRLNLNESYSMGNHKLLLRKCSSSYCVTQEFLDTGCCSRQNSNASRNPSGLLMFTKLAEVEDLPDDT